MKLQPLEKPKRRLADQAHEQIVQAIYDGSFTPDDRIVQEKLASQLGISRTPVREALFRLEQEGLLEDVGNGGFRLRLLGQEEITEIYEARCAIEGHAACSLAARCDLKVLDHLREKIREAERVEHPSVKAYFLANRKVHRAIVGATGNRYLLELFDNIWNRGPSYTMFATLEKVDLSKSLGGHQELVDAIETGDQNLARAKMCDHIRDGMIMQIDAVSA